MAILAAVLVPTVTSKIRDANESAANSSASAVANNVQSEIISIKSGLASTDNKYVVAGADGAITIKEGYSTKEGNATITLDSHGGSGAYIKITAKVSSSTATYYVSTADGKVTTTDPVTPAVGG